MQSVLLQPLPQTGAVLEGYLHDPGDEFIQRDVRPCVLICPGGGYCRLASHEAEPIAMQFYNQGYQAFVLSYSVWDANRPDDAQPLGVTPLRDAAVAMKTIRQHCAQWRVNPERIAICGFSAGGHLAASLGVLWNSAELKAVLDTGENLVRPDAMILCYPVITAGEYAHKDSIDRLAGRGDREPFSLEKRVSSHTPPAFLWHTADDELVPVENTLLFAKAMQRAGVSCETHIFAHGVHGLGLANKEARYENKSCTAWMPLCIQWLGELFGYSM